MTMKKAHEAWKTGALIGVVIVVGVVIGLQNARPNRPASRASMDLRRVGRQGMVDFYVADQQIAGDRSLLESRLRQLCEKKGGDFCQLMVWVDPASVPRALPMSDAQMRAQIAQYNRNRNTGYDRFILLGNGEILEETR